MKNQFHTSRPSSGCFASKNNGANNSGNAARGMQNPSALTANYASWGCRPARTDSNSVSSCLRAVNLVQNPSFEEEYSYWWTNNVYIGNTNVFEGTAVAVMGSGVASLHQELDLLYGAVCRRLFFSFNAMGGAESCYNGTLTAQIVWLDKEYNQIGIGLRMFVPDGRITNTARLTFFALTDQVPAQAVYARISFSKGQGTSSDAILIDQVLLAPLAGYDLLTNSDFESDLLGWTANPTTAFISDHKLSLEGAGHVRTHFNGTLTQDVYIRSLPPGSSFLFSFAAGGVGAVMLYVHVDWLDSNKNPIGSGLSLQIPNETLSLQGNYLSYLNLTEPTLPGTAYARIIFDAIVPNSSCYLLLDQVLFARVMSDNLIVNPSFENGLNDWEATYVTLVQRNDVYEGAADAGIGQIGGALWQEIDLTQAEGHSYLFSTGLGFRRTSSEATFGTMLMKVVWLDPNRNEIGLGLCLIGTSSNQTGSEHQWVPYVGITEPAPPGTAGARIQFTKTESTDGYIEIDNVVFGRLI
ncbi:MAG TPA: hypothetical protein PLC88_00745 [Syntrophomonas sp.]|nr:hypothetical protein [Syntrophomonas sp.]